MNIQKHRRRLSATQFEDFEFVGYDLRNALAQSSRWTRCHFKNCKLDLSHFGDATFVDCTFEGCSLRAAVLVSHIWGCTFINCEMDQANLQGSEIQNTTFSGCRMEYSNWSSATLQRVKVVDCAMHGARLDMAESADCEWTGSNLWGAVVPIGCSFFRGGLFDRRQMHLLLALLTHTAGNDAEREMLGTIVERRYRRIVGRLVNEDINGKDLPAGQDDGGAAHGNVDDQDSEVRDSGDTSRVLAG